MQSDPWDGRERTLPNVVRYSFRQDFAVSAKEAFEWCTDYTPQDHDLLGHSRDKRQIQRLAQITLIITDAFQTPTGQVEIQKLVHLYPDTLSWNATPLTGPIRYSQFQYQIVSDGENQSHLNFTGLVLDYGKELSHTEIEALASQLCMEDAHMWKLFAKAMAKDFENKR